MPGHDIWPGITTTVEGSDTSSIVSPVRAVQDPIRQDERVEQQDRLDSAVLAGGLAARYAQPHRHYHTAEHVHQVLAVIDELGSAPADELPLKLAAWFHDAIYAPGRDDNEERSAFLAKDALEMVGESPELGDEVARLVRLTARHNPKRGDWTGAVLCDADLRILGSTSNDYASYAAAIREEYALVPDDIFRPSRARILRQFLARATVFHTPVGQKRWENAARVNISREIDHLEGAPEMS